MPHTADTFTCNQWLAFELSVLRRLQFRSVALPWMGTPACAAQLKRWGVRVHVNSERESEFVCAVAHVENNSARLTTEDIAALTTDAYVPGHELRFPELRLSFNESDAWWFDNLRPRIAQLTDRTHRALALDLCLRTADYALSFDDTTRHLRQSLTIVMHRLWQETAPPFDNGQANSAHSQNASAFLADRQVDLALIRLPRIASLMRAEHEQTQTWRDVWLRGEQANEENSLTQTPSLHTLPHAIRTSLMLSKTQYLRFVEDLLARSAHLRQWAIMHAADGFVSTEELVETIRRVRGVKTVYTKDLSEWTGVRASIITA
jgi:hypothetical protein